MATKSEIEQLIKRLSKTEKVLFGTFSGIVATVIVHPLDVIKVRLQVHEKSYNTRTLVRLILKCEGVRALYAGLSAGVMRQTTYTTTRLVVYHALNEHIKRLYRSTKHDEFAYKGQGVNRYYGWLIGGSSWQPFGGGVGTHDGGGEERAVRLLHWSSQPWRDSSVMEVNANVGKRKILEGDALHVFTSIVSSFVTTIISLPVDLIKSRYQLRRDSVTPTEILNDILKRKGVLYLWKGIVPYFVRMAIHTVTTLMILEKITETLYYGKKGR